MNPSMSDYEAVAESGMSLLSNGVHGDYCLAEEPAERVHDDCALCGDRALSARGVRLALAGRGPRAGAGHERRCRATPLSRWQTMGRWSGRVSQPWSRFTRAMDSSSGIIDRLTCSENLDRVIAHIMPVGAFYPSPGGGGTFRLGTAHQPRIRAKCFLVEGERLSQFMASVADGVSPEERLILGRYGNEDGAKAVADGNRLFQRHLAILGNSGAGKTGRSRS